MHSKLQLLTLFLVGVSAAGPAFAQKFREMYRTDIPEEITVPAVVETRLGALRFKDGFPDDATVQKVYDNLDFQRAVQAYLNTMQAASLSAMRKGLRGIGVNNGSLAIFETRLDSRTLFLAPDPDYVYLMGWLDLKDGPIVVEMPPDVTGFVSDFWSRRVTEIGNAGPDQGNGGKFLFLPPDYTGEPPGEGYLVAHSTTRGNWLLVRGSLMNGDPAPAASSLKKHLRVYPLALAANPPETRFFNASGYPFNTIPAMDASFYDEVNNVVQEEPAAAADPEVLGLLASIGIQKGRPFAPDTRMKKILAEAAGLANATARTLAYRPRDKARLLAEGSAWLRPPRTLERDGARMVDASSSLFVQSLGDTPHVSPSAPDAGLLQVLTLTDAHGWPLDGGKNYHLHLPPRIPAKDWSLAVYDNQTRSQLQTSQQFPTISTRTTRLAINRDTSVDVYFGPTAPAGEETNWIQTIPNKGWHAMFRVDGPLGRWLDGTWKLPDIEEVN